MIVERLPERELRARVAQPFAPRHVGAGAADEQRELGAVGQGGERAERARQVERGRIGRDQHRADRGARVHERSASLGARLRAQRGNAEQPQPLGSGLEGVPPCIDDENGSSHGHDTPHA